jgi:hypothetical protein
MAATWPGSGPKSPKNRGERAAARVRAAKLEVQQTKDFDPVEDALERAPWCLLVPIPDFGFTDPDIIGPFATYEEARNWSLSYLAPSLGK